MTNFEFHITLEAGISSNIDTLLKSTKISWLQIKFTMELHTPTNCFSSKFGAL